MSGCMSRGLSALATLLVAVAPTAVSAQWYPTTSSCYCAQPVAQTVYQSVPVTEYRQVRQTVQRPVVETKYVDQQVTEYRPVVETKTASIPTVQYQNVTEYQTMQHNAGYWATQYQAVPKVSACEYDNRPDIFGLIVALTRASRVPVPMTVAVMAPCSIL